MKTLNYLEKGLVLSCAPGPWSAEQSAEHALGHHPLPRDLGWPGAGHQEAVEDVAVLLRPFCIQILKSGNIFHLLEGKRHSSINPCIIRGVRSDVQLSCTETRFQKCC